MDEIWDRPTSPGKEYKGLGVQGIVTIQYPPYQGKGKAFFAVAASPMVSGQDLESRFTQAYLMAVPEIEDETKSMFERGELSGFQITYRRPWGEPWWQFSDIWLERNSVIYVLSFYASPNSFDTYSDTFNQILESIQFKD